MPRKGSKKATLHKKPKLKFVSSPLHGPSCPISPVLGALNPLTAKSVTADESNITWVSPHFQDLANRVVSCTKIPVVLRRKNLTKKRHVSNGQENISNKRQIKLSKKLRALKFLKDDSIDETSTEMKSLPHDHELDTTPVTDVSTPDVSADYANSHHVHDNFTKMCFEEGSNRLNEVSIVPNLINSPLRILNLSCETDGTMECSGNRRSSRLKEKYLESLKVARTPPRRNKSVTVLVADTPETEYGYNVRRRQLGKLKVRRPQYSAVS